jgi:hypothetical protein
MANDKMHLFLQLTKADAAKRLVYGTAAAEELDKANEIFDYDSSKPLFEKWSSEIAKASDGKSLGNVRAMHGKVAAGKLEELSFSDASKTIEVCAKIVDDNEWVKVEEGVYTGFSIGGRYAKRWKDGDAYRYTAEPSEISLVDSPCIKSATFSMLKTDGSTEDRLFKTAATPRQPEPELEQVWKAKDGQTFKTKSEAKNHNEELTKAAQPQVVQDLQAALSGVSKALDAKTSPPAEAALAVAESGIRLRREEHADLRKDLYTVGRLAELIQSLEWLQQNVEYEAEEEADGSAVPGSLKSIVVSLCAALRAMVAEETAELMDEKDADALEMAERTAGVDALAKVLGDGVPRLLAKVGSKYVAPTPVKEAELQKQLDAALLEKGQLEKAVADAIPVVKDLEARVKKLEDQPIPGGPRTTEYRVVGKGDEEAAAAGALLSEIAKNNPEAIAAALIKASQTQPQRFGGAIVPGTGQ